MLSLFNSYSDFSYFMHFYFFKLLSGCLINAGVMLIRVSEWSRTLWQEVWDCNKYDDVTFYEQSALIRRLRAKREGLGKWSFF